MNFIDFFIIIILIFGAIIGFKRGIIKSVVSLIGTILIILLSFYFKNPIAALMYEKLPFFSFNGQFAGITVLNILIYEAIAFIIISSVLGLLLKIILMLTRLVDMLLNSLIILSVPSKFLGLIIGIAQSYLLVFCSLFIFTQVHFFAEDVKASKFGDIILTNTPFLSPYIDDVYDVFNEIYELTDKYQEAEDKDKFNAEAFDTLLKYDIISIDSADKLIKSGKLKINDADKIVDKYR